MLVCTRRNDQGAGLAGTLAGSDTPGDNPRAQRDLRSAAGKPAFERAEEAFSNPGGWGASGLGRTGGWSAPPYAGWTADRHARVLAQPIFQLAYKRSLLLHDNKADTADP